MLIDKIRTIYPNIDDKDFYTVIELRNDSDGKGDYIKNWSHPTLKQPTQAELDAI